MKILKSSIFADTKTATNSGTTFYYATIGDIIKAFESDDSNIWIQKAFTELEWDAIDLDNHLFGSQIVGDNLYICVTDGYDIEIDGNLVNPEEALELYTPDTLDDYIKPATDKIIHKYITEYELNTPDFDKWAVDLLEDNVEFSRLVRDYQDFT